MMQLLDILWLGPSKTPLDKGDCRATLCVISLNSLTERKATDLEIPFLVKEVSVALFEMN